MRCERIALPTEPYPRAFLLYNFFQKNSTVLTHYFQGFYFFSSLETRRQKYGYLQRHIDKVNFPYVILYRLQIQTRKKRPQKNETSIINILFPFRAMWWNYRNPHPFKTGGFRMAYRAGVPVITAFVTMKDDEKNRSDGFPVQIHTVHVIKPIYPDTSLPMKEAVKNMAENCLKKYFFTK